MPRARVDGRVANTNRRIRRSSPSRCRGDRTRRARRPGGTARWRATRRAACARRGRPRATATATTTTTDANDDDAGRRTRARARTRKGATTGTAARGPAAETGETRSWGSFTINLWIAFAAYALGATFALQKIPGESDFARPADAAYFVAISATTVGYGDMSPKTDEGKVFVMVLLVTGVAMAGVAMTKVTDWILKAQERAMNAVMERSKARMAVDMAKLRAQVGADASADQDEELKRALAKKEERTFRGEAAVSARASVGRHRRRRRSGRRRDASTRGY